MIYKGFHLTYCTNIHPGETWDDTFNNLKRNIPPIKARVSTEAPFGIGLRLSDMASRTLMEGDRLSNFKSWLTDNDCYVFTLNGFPYGGFHHQAVKDDVHRPDWTTNERLDYSLRLFDILAALLPEGIDGGISTSPLSYRYWPAAQQNREDVFQKASLNMAKIAGRLYTIHQNENKMLHLDIEPEPDGLLENTQEVIEWFRTYLIPQGTEYLIKEYHFSRQEAEDCLKQHIRLCYDVCDFALVYEQPQDVFSLLKREGIKIGKIQISAALKADLSGSIAERNQVKEALLPFVESTYLHQVIEKKSNGELKHYPDLPQALEEIDNPEATEWRTHFHVPVFLDNYGRLESTQEDILEVFAYLKAEKVTQHLEVETYTWEVLPSAIQIELIDSIVRELQWVQKNL